MASLLVVGLYLPASLATIQHGKNDAIDRAAERQRLAQSIGKDRTGKRTPRAQPMDFQAIRQLPNYRNGSAAFSSLGV
jgi:hypothetical protein